mgnify:FL=1
MQSDNIDTPLELLFDSNNILPLSKNRIIALRRIIDGRKVAILVGGSSLTEFHERIEEFEKYDICFFGINRFIQESHILGRIHKKYSIFMNSTRKNMPNHFDDILFFLNREEDNIFISSLYGDAFGLMPDSFNFGSFSKAYNNKLLFFWVDDQGSYPNKSNPLVFNSGNSLMVSIQLAIIGKASEIILFGADGYSKRNSGSDYFKHELYSPGDYYNTGVEDTRYFFNRNFSRLISNVYRTYNLEKINIINCSSNSNYLWLPKFTYDEILIHLDNPKRIGVSNRFMIYVSSIVINSFVMACYHAKRIKNIPKKIRKILDAKK